MSVILYDLAGADPALRFSPYCWRTKLALAHKGLTVETIPWRFTEKDRLSFSGQGRVPVIVDGESVVFDSWTIAEYLENTYPDRPSLFGGPMGRAHARFINGWADSSVHPGIARMVVCDIFGVLALQDQAYFRASREVALGATLEAVVEGREQRLEAWRTLLTPVRLVLRAQAFLGGEGPSYADHILFGTLQWPRCVSAFALLAPDDPVAAWFGRVGALYGGLGAGARTV
jgi:glutathione S-transferase